MQLGLNLLQQPKRHRAAVSESSGGGGGGGGGVDCTGQAGGSTRAHRRQRSVRFHSVKAPARVQGFRVAVSDPGIYHCRLHRCSLARRAFGPGPGAFSTVTTAACQGSLRLCPVRAVSDRERTRYTQAVVNSGQRHCRAEWVLRGLEPGTGRLAWVIQGRLSTDSETLDARVAKRRCLSPP